MSVEGDAASPGPLRGDTGVPDVDLRPDAASVVEDASLTDAPVSSDVCDNGLDDDADGQIDEQCGCAPGRSQSCYGGPFALAGIGACTFGNQTCPIGSQFGEWTACEGWVPPIAETCDTIDNDCDGAIDEELGPDSCCNGVGEGCEVCLEPDPADAIMDAPWQIHLGEDPMCFGTRYSTHGEVAEYSHSTIPAEADAAWAPHPEPTISFSESSTLCGLSCTCLDGGDFTYFQTFFTIPTSHVVASLLVTITNVDDGVRVTLFNDLYPGGITPDGAYAFIGGGSTSDLAAYVAPGRNRIVLTHIDDCCTTRQIAGATVTIDGAPVSPCDDDPVGS